MTHRLLALLCVCLALLSAIPCTAAPAQQAKTHAAMIPHCAPCCKSSLIAVNRLCCQANPQPGQASSTTNSHEAATFAACPATWPDINAVVALADAQTPPQPAPPPLLHPILRI